MRNLLEVTFTDVKGVVQTCTRVFQTLRAARSFAVWLESQSWAREVRIFRGGVGGEFVATRKAA